MIREDLYGTWADQAWTDSGKHNAELNPTDLQSLFKSAFEAGARKADSSDSVAPTEPVDVTVDTVNSNP